MADIISIVADGMVTGSTFYSILFFILFILFSLYFIYFIIF